MNGSENTPSLAVLCTKQLLPLHAVAVVDAIFLRSLVDMVFHRAALTWYVSTIRRITSLIASHMRSVP